MNFRMREPSVATAKRPPWQKGLGAVATLALAFLLAGCGQKGPLTLPAPAGAASAPGGAR